MQKLTISWSGRDFMIELEWNVDSSSDKHKQHGELLIWRSVSAISTSVFPRIRIGSNEISQKLMYGISMSSTEIRLSSACSVYLYLFFRIELSNFELSTEICVLKLHWRIKATSTTLIDVLVYQNTCTF